MGNMSCMSAQALGKAAAAAKALKEEASKLHPTSNEEADKMQAMMQAKIQEEAARMHAKALEENAAKTEGKGKAATKAQGKQVAQPPPPALAEEQTRSAGTEAPTSEAEAVSSLSDGADTTVAPSDAQERAQAEFVRYSPITAAAF